MRGRGRGRGRGSGIGRGRSCRPCSSGLRGRKCLLLSLSLVM